MNSKILIIDDDTRLIMVHSMILESKGFEVVSAPDGKSGIEKMKEFKPDLILLDAMMPGFSGFDTLAEIKSMPDYKDTKVVMLTALSNDEMREKALSLGANDYIVKSQLTIEEIIELIKDTIGN